MRPNPEEVEAQVKRIAESGPFAGSDAARSLLLYLSGHALKHPGESVKEITLATEVLGRGNDYDPRSDSTVRVVVSRLRSKLAEYYTGDGIEDNIIISIPKGSYSITGKYRAPGLDGAVPVAPPPEHPAVRPSWGSKTLAALILGILVGFAPAYYLGRKVSRPAVPAAAQAFWRHFLSGDPPIVVFSNPGFVVGRDSTLRLLGPAEVAAPGEVINGQYTGIGEVAAAHNIVRQLELFGAQPRLRRARVFSWEDARSSDLVIVGGQQQNTAMSQLPKFEKFNMVPAVPGAAQPAEMIRNEMPAAGERPVYSGSTDPENGIEYAIIAYTQGLTPAQRVLILAGIYTFGTEGAGAFVCNPALLESLARKLEVRSGEDFPPFEALIQMQVRGGSIATPVLVTAHRRSDSPTAR